MPWKDKEKQRAYREKNKERHKIYGKEYREKNKEILKQKVLADPLYHQKRTFRNWKNAGLVGDFEEIYEIYQNCNSCMKCGVDLVQSKRPTPNRKCMDHSHATGEYRAIICHTCNTSNLGDILPRNDNKLGIRNISYSPQYGYQFKKTIKGKRHQKYFKTLEEAIAYKEEYMNNL